MVWVVNFIVRETGWFEAQQIDVVYISLQRRRVVIAKAFETCKKPTESLLVLYSRDFADTPVYR